MKIKSREGVSLIQLLRATVMREIDVIVYILHFYEGDLHGYEKLLPSRTEPGLFFCGKQNNSVHDFHGICTAWKLYLCKSGVCCSVPVWCSETDSNSVLPFGCVESI